jgi:endoribonuclease LACTB2
VDAPLPLPVPVAGPGVRVVSVRSPTLPPATTTNAWVLGTQDVWVIDPASPWTDEQDRLAASLSGLRVRGIVLTHHHQDHVGGAAALRNATKAPIYAHPLTAALLPPGLVDAELDAGDSIETDQARWVVHHTPGHATGHVCLFEAVSRTVVAGDMVAGEGTIVLDPPHGVLADYLDSLSRLLELQPGCLLPAHGPAIADGPAFLRAYIDHRNSRTRQIEAALAALSVGTPADLVPLVYPDLDARMAPVAARQVLCHLQWLVEQQRAGTFGANSFTSEAR